MIKAIARGFRWRKLLKTGVYGTIEEIAAAEKINSSYVSRLLRMTLLAIHNAPSSIRLALISLVSNSTNQGHRLCVLSQSEPLVSDSSRSLLWPLEDERSSPQAGAIKN